MVKDRCAPVGEEGELARVAVKVGEATVRAADHAHLHDRASAVMVLIVRLQ